MRILITCFELCKGRARNGSQALARYRQSHLPDQHIRLLDIPVRWSIVEALILAVIEEWERDLVLGLGEGGTDVGRAGSIHVPPRGDDDEAAYCERFGPVVEQILRQSLRMRQR